MNGEKPKFKPWTEVAVEETEMIHFLEQSLEIHRAILKEAQAHARGK